MDHCRQYGNLTFQSRLKKSLVIQHVENVALSYTEKTKIYEGEIAQLPVLLVQQFRWCNAFLARLNPPYLRYPNAPQQGR